MGVHVNHRDALADEHVAQERQQHEARWQHHPVVHAAKWQVVHLEPARQPADAAPLAVSVGDDHDFVALHEQALRELVHVILHAAHRRVEEIGDHADVDHGAVPRQNRERSCAAPIERAALKFLQVPPSVGGHMRTPPTVRCFYMASAARMRHWSAYQEYWAFTAGALVSATARSQCAAAFFG